MSEFNGVPTPPPRPKPIRLAPVPKPPTPPTRKSKIADALGERYKQLNALWEQAEKDLKGIPVPHDVPVSLWEACPEAGEFENAHLGFARCDDGWRICYGTTDPRNRGMDDFGWKPILDCTVDVRLKAVSKINELREAVLKAAEDCVSRVDKAIDELRNSLKNW